MQFRFPASRLGFAGVQTAALLAAVLIVVAPAARAQGLFEFFEASPRQIARNIEEAGYEIRGPLIRRGDVYVCDAIGESGRRVRLVVDARNGQVIERFAARRPAWAEGDDFDAARRDRRDLYSAPRRPLESDADEGSPPERVARGPSGDDALPLTAGGPLVIPGIGKPDASEPAKPKPHVAKRRPAPPATSTAKAAPDAPNPSQPETADAPSATSPADPPKPAASSLAAASPSAPVAVAPDVAPVAPETHKAIAEPAKTPIEAAKPVDAPPKPVAEAKPAPRTTPKKLNDLPVSPLD